MQCIICSSIKIHSFARFANLNRVTSDAKPWPAAGTLNVCCQCGLVQKNVDELWLKEIASIYEHYDVYHQSAGEEQAVFNFEGQATKRSHVLTQFIKNANVLIKNNGIVLDYGCGNGEFLNAFSASYPECELFGLDLSDKYKQQLEAIPNFKKLYQAQNSLEKKFDLISIIHTLEHLINPIETLVSIRNMLNKNGMIFIQVPNILANPYDILIADHVSHFSPNNLHHILSLAGYQIVCIETNVVSKEITVLALPNSDQVTSSLHIDDSELFETKNLIEQYIEFDYQMIADTKKLQLAGEFAIFGTSISSTWLYSYFPDVSFFVEEDPNRIGKTHFGKPVYSPNQIYGTSTPIAIPLTPSIAEQVIGRHFIRMPTNDGAYSITIPKF